MPIGRSYLEIARRNPPHPIPTPTPLRPPGFPTLPTVENSPLHPQNVKKPHAVTVHVRPHATPYLPPQAPPSSPPASVFTQQYLHGRPGGLAVSTGPQVPQITLPATSPRPGTQNVTTTGSTATAPSGQMPHPQPWWVSVGEALEGALANLGQGLANEVRPVAQAFEQFGQWVEHLFTGWQASKAPSGEEVHPVLIGPLIYPPSLPPQLPMYTFQALAAPGGEVHTPRGVRVG